MLTSLQHDLLCGVQRRKHMDDFTKDFLLAITVTAVAVLLSGMVQWLKT